jgi:hypothetical protein
MSMLSIGGTIYLKDEIPCPSCGQLNRNCMNEKSAFIVTICRNEECEYRSQQVIIEKASSQILWASGIPIDGKPTFPALVFADGSAAWPKVKVIA